MQTKYDIGDKILLEVEVKNINVDYRGILEYKIVFRDSAGKLEAALVTESQLKTCLAVEK